MGITGLVSLFFAVSTLFLAVLYGMQRRELRALQGLSQQVQRIAIGGRLTGRVDLATDHPDLSALVTAINHLLARAAAGPDARNGNGHGHGHGSLFSDVGDRVHEVVLIHGESILYANPQFANLLGVERKDVVGRRLQDLVPPDHADLVSDNLRKRLAGEPAPERYEIDLIGLQGQLSRLEIATALTTYDGAPALLITGVEVIPTQTVPALSLLQGGPGRSRARTALESLAEAVITTDLQGRIDYANPAAAQLLGADARDLAGRRLDEVVSLVDETDRKLLSDPVQQAISTGSAVSLGRRAMLLSRANGSERSIELSASPIRSRDNATEEIVGTVVLLHDVTELRGFTRQMSYQATHDALTGLINRREFERRLSEALEVAHRGDGTHVLCFLDLDRFKAVNDTSGHLAGDSMLREVAKLMRDSVRDSDTVGRLGGDEFGVLLMGCPLEKARQIADDLARRVGDFRFVWKDRVYNIGASVGLLELARDSGSLEEAIAAADSACYVAKRQGTGNVAVYSARDEVVARQSGEIQWLQMLQNAIRRNRFELYSQPIVAAYGDNGRGPSMEVLLRLKDENGHDVSPADFVHAAERYRLIGLVDRWVVQTTLTALGRGAIQLPGDRSLALNVSGQTIADPQFLEFVVECLDRTGANPAQVCFEIAESAVVANLDAARRFVGVLHGMGCQFALDDFGSNLGSFANLKNLPLDYLKIDGSFMRNLPRDSVNQAMVAAMIKLARTLNFKVIAEHCEDNAVIDAARSMGIDYLQGYAIGRPAPLSLLAA
jgi:diguanylate cyclase (GGDEF)-like protein/PAS domain S-box-containing protein